VNRAVAQTGLVCFKKNRAQHNELKQEAVVSRVLAAMMVLELMCVSAMAQQSTSTAQQQSTDAGKAKLVASASSYEDAVRKIETTHGDDKQLAKLYDNLGVTYEDLAWYPKAEAALRKEVALLQKGPQGELAEALNHLSVLHVLMGQEHQAEKDESRALEVREAEGDPIGMAQTYTDASGLYYRDKHYAKALDYAQRAMAVLGNNPNASPDSRIAVHQALAFSLCALGRCEEGIPLLKDALEIAETDYGPESLRAGLATFALGYGAWRNGDVAGANRWMGEGIARMKPDLGWGHVLYVHSLQEYEQFLRQTRQNEAAVKVQLEMNTLNKTVDVRAMTLR
jgi:tetratricopeptide (TPR) repeat protein